MSPDMLCQAQTRANFRMEEWNSYLFSSNPDFIWNSIPAALTELHLHLGLSRDSCINCLVSWLEIGIQQNHLILNDFLAQDESDNFCLNVNWLDYTE